MTLIKKIALEEHFSAPGFDRYHHVGEERIVPSVGADIGRRLPELDAMRLEAMDRGGIAISVLSQTAPGVQRETDAKAAAMAAMQANDFLAERIGRHPDRFRGFAHLAMHDPDVACAELNRCVKELGFVGALVNGHTNGTYLDDARYRDFWKLIAALDVPLYLHPADSMDTPQMYRGYPDLEGPFWSWTVETATHALRLMLSGLFDELPGLKIVLGHMGETLPFIPWRLDSRYKWNQHEQPLKKMPSEYLRSNFWITTSGVCDAAAMLCAVKNMGEDHVMFSVDYPFEESATACEFMDSAQIDEDLRTKIAHDNAASLLKL